MARKRGGIAGFYDRNKGKIRTLASMGAGAIGGPLAGAAVGAAFRGLDREGKSGIGFDPFAALPGAVEGYMAGQTGESIKGGIKRLLAPKLAERAGAKGLAAGTKALEGFQVPDLTNYNAMPDVGLRQRGIFEGLTGEGGTPITSRLTTAGVPKLSAARPTASAAARTIPSSSAVRMPSMPTGMTNQFPGMGEIGGASYGGAPNFGQPSFQMGLPSSGVGGMPAGQPGPLGRFPMGIGPEIPGGGVDVAAMQRRIAELEKAQKAGTAAPMTFRQAMYQPQVIGAGIQGLLGALPNPQVGQQNELMQQRVDLEKAQFEEEKRRAEEERLRRQRIAELLMPYMQQSFPQYFGGR